MTSNAGVDRDQKHARIASSGAEVSPRGSRPTSIPQDSSAGELRRTWIGALLGRLYRVLNCRRRRRLGAAIISLILRWEGAMTSATARRLMLEEHGVDIGAYSYGDCFNPAIMPRNVTIGRYTSFASGVRLFLENHPLDRMSTHPMFYERRPGDPSSSDVPAGSLEIGHDVWIGCNAIITPGCRRVGNGAVIGAGAVVTKNVPDFAIVAGNPARRIRDRFPAEVIERLNHQQWWLLSGEEARSLLPEFDQLLPDELLNSPTDATERADLETAKN